MKKNFDWWISLFHSSFNFVKKFLCQTLSGDEKSQFRNKLIWYIKQQINFAFFFFLTHSMHSFIDWFCIHFFLFLTHSMHTLTYWYVKQWWYVLSSSLPDWFSFTHKVPWSGAISVKYKVYNCDHSNYKNYKIKWPLSLWYKNWSHLNCL